MKKNFSIVFLLFLISSINFHTSAQNNDVLKIVSYLNTTFERNPEFDYKKGHLYVSFKDKYNELHHIDVVNPEMLDTMNISIDYETGKIKCYCLEHYGECVERELVKEGSTGYYKSLIFNRGLDETKTAGVEKALLEIMRIHQVIRYKPSFRFE